MSHRLDLRMASAALPIEACSIPDCAWVPSSSRSVFCRASSSLTRASASPFLIVTMGLRSPSSNVSINRDNACLCCCPVGPENLPVSSRLNVKDRGAT
jgi:hypothetical protein